MAILRAQTIKKKPIYQLNDKWARYNQLGVKLAVIATYAEQSD